MDGRKGYRGYSEETFQRIHKEMEYREKIQEKPEQKQKGKGKWIPAHRTASGVRFGYWRKRKEAQDE